MGKAAVTYQSVVISGEYKEYERVRAKARHNEASALYNAEEQGAKIEREKWQKIIAEKDALIAELDAAIVESDRVIDEANRVIDARDRALADGDEALSEYDTLINEQATALTAHSELIAKLRAKVARSINHDSFDL